FRQEVVYKRTTFDLRKAREKEHVLEGIITALQNIDAVIELIKKSASAEDAVVGLNAKFQLTEIQSKAVLDIRLQRLTSMEQDKIRLEIQDLKELIIELRSILEDNQK